MVKKTKGLMDNATTIFPLAGEKYTLMFTNLSKCKVITLITTEILSMSKCLHVDKLELEHNTSMFPLKTAEIKLGYLIH